MYRDMKRGDFVKRKGVKEGTAFIPERDDVPATSTTIPIEGRTTREFIIPLYSGVIGVLMPQKKFIPLEYLPLDIEITLNQYALYSSHSTLTPTYEGLNK